MSTNQRSIVVIPGHGIGPEIFHVALPYIDRVCSHYGRKVTWITGDIPENSPCTPRPVLDLMKEHGLGIKGPLTTPTGEGTRSYNVETRQELDLYACVRPVKWYKGVPSPMVYPDAVNTVIFRENTQDIYMGIELKNVNSFEISAVERTFKQNPDFFNRADEWNFSLKPISRLGSQRLIRAAINYAIKHNLPSVTISHKGNIMKATEGSFLRYAYELAKNEYSQTTFTEQEYDARAKVNEEAANVWYDEMKREGRIYIKSLIADNTFQQLLLNPEHHPVIATMNLNGDYFSDAVAAQVGGLGIAPGGNINYETGRALYEATHGTAPRIAGKNMANPSSILLSSVMMFNQIDWVDVADQIENDLAALYEQHAFTSDFSDIYNKVHKASGKKLNAVSTSTFMELLHKRLELVHA